MKSPITNNLVHIDRNRKKGDEQTFKRSIFTLSISLILQELFK